MPAGAFELSAGSHADFSDRRNEYSSSPNIKIKILILIGALALPIYRIKNNLILFSHIPKTGGTSVHIELSKKGKRSLFSEHQCSIFRIPPQHFDTDTLKYLFEIDIFDYSFAITREPISRLVSEFFYRNPLGEPKNIWHKAIYSLKGKRKQGRILRNFSGWIAYYFEKYKINDKILDNHIKPQSEFVIKDEMCFFRIEDGLKNLEKDLYCYCGNIKFKRYNQSSKIPFTIDRETKNKIIEFYYKDYELFKY